MSDPVQNLLNEIEDRLIELMKNVPKCPDCKDDMTELHYLHLHFPKDKSCGKEQ